MARRRKILTEEEIQRLLFESDSESDDDSVDDPIFIFPQSTDQQLSDSKDSFDDNQMNYIMDIIQASTSTSQDSVPSTITHAPSITSDNCKRSKKKAMQKNEVVWKKRNMKIPLELIQFRASNNIPQEISSLETPYQFF